MNARKAKLLRFLVLVLVISVFTGCKGEDGRLREALAPYAKIVEQDSLDGLRLKIYYISPSIFTRAPLTVEGLIRWSEEEIIVDSERLQEYAALLKQLSADALTPVQEPSYLNARLCYLFETEDGTILEIAVGGVNNSVFVNGIEVEYNELFYEIIAPFLTDAAREEIEIYFHGWFFSSPE